METPTLLVIRGIPGSGKSTIAFSLVQSGLFGDYFEADMYFMTVDGYKYDKSKIKAAHEWCFDQVCRSLKQGRSTIVANTNTQRWQYEKYIDFAKDEGYNVQVMQLASTFDNIHGVSEDIVFRMSNELFEDGVLTKVV